MLVERTLKKDGGHGMLEFTMPEAVVMVEAKLIGHFHLALQRLILLVMARLCGKL